jgi:hypothetical protein
MVAVTVDGKPHSLELPPDCLSVADAASYAKRQLAASWAAASSASTAPDIVHFEKQLWELCGVYDTGHGGPTKKRLFLSAKGWQPGGGVAEDASLLGFRQTSSGSVVSALDELPAFLLRGSQLKLQAFSAKRAQVTIDLPNGRTVVLPVSEATCCAHVAAYIAPMLCCDPAAVHLWRDGHILLRNGDQAVPGHHYRAKVAASAGPNTEEIFVKSLTGKTITLHLSLVQTVEELKQAIFEVEGTPVDQLRLIF